MLAKSLMLVFALSPLAACTSTDKVHDIDTKDFEEKGSAERGKIGVNSEKKVVIRENTSAQDDLAVAQLANTHLRDQLERDLADLKACENQLNDPRLGGSGHISQSPDVEALQNLPERTSDMGLDEDGNLRVVKEQSFAETLKAEQKYGQTLKRMSKSAKEHLEQCGQQLAVARQSHGLPGKPYKASGYFTSDGTWVETQKGEASLDDAFEISAKAKAKAGGKDGNAN